jgi:beta-ureidopropionase / N-carbamoyl-L-amino-acid hydrolase
MSSTPTVDRERLLASLDEYAMIGATPSGGVTRLALSEQDRAVRDRFREDVVATGAVVSVDDIGTIVARRPGREGLPPIQIGSHLDSVRNGGRFDGVLGVLGGLEVLRALETSGHATRHPIEVIDWTNEEGVRFEPAMMGSGVAYGAFDRDWADGRTDRDGVRFGDALDTIGYRGDITNRPAPGEAYLELHIEQGPVMDDAGVAVGVVEGILGITWMNVIIEGQADHAGPSPMALRRDALAAAAEVISMVEALAIESGPPVVGTVGRLAPEPGLVNVVPGRVEMSVDLRHMESDGLDALVSTFTERADAIASRRGVDIAVDRFWTSVSTPFDPGIVAAIAAAAGPEAMRLWSGAGHDAKYAADAGPAGMIFVRSRGGLSHCEEELSEPDDIVAGVATLLQTVLALDERRDADS